MAKKKKTSGVEARGSQVSRKGPSAQGPDKRDGSQRHRTVQPMVGGKFRRALSREGQNAAALDVLRRRPVDTLELRRMGMASPAARIQDLEAMGCVIDSARIVAVDSDGFLHSGVALYSLVSEPEVLVDLEALS